MEIDIVGLNNCSGEIQSLGNAESREHALEEIKRMYESDKRVNAVPKLYGVLEWIEQGE